ncbi:MAG TPA: FG-GAP-like repeat-containing protein [Chthoniobacterales bacterium]|nr:FG-GAP-like repeat-containing protein [Chthoniobacterales bacterium]
MPLLREGIELARRRRVVLAELIQNDPAAAIAAAVPEEVRRELPGEIVALLETRVSGLGDYIVLAELRARGGPKVEPVSRYVQLAGRKYRAYVYGRRLDETTKYDIPLHGIVLDGTIALHERALRTLDAGEAAALGLGIIDLRTSASGGPSDPILAQAGDRIYRFSAPKQAFEAEALLEKYEATLNPFPRHSTHDIMETIGRHQSDAESAIPDPESSYTEGNKNVLIIRVDFSDLVGEPRARGGTPIYTATYVKNVADTEIKPYYLESSYGATSLTNTVSTLVYRMPQTAAFYATNGSNDQLHSDARAAAAANFTLANYQRIVVLFSDLGNIPGSHITYGGLAQVGGGNAWINAEFDFRVVAHELGHTYGLLHANLWQVSDGNPISAGGFSAEYEDDFDTMGANFANDNRTDFSPWSKNRLDWIPNTKITTVTTSGTYRINRFDNSTGTGVLGLKIVKDGSRNYWVGCRRKFTDNPSMLHGAYIIWGYNGAQQSNLLDMTTPGNDEVDAALAIGTTFTDAAAHVSIRPVAEGGTSPNQYLDVQVTVLGNNDNFANAQPLDGRRGNTGGDNTNATKEPGEPDHAGNGGGRSVWYRWIAPASGGASFDTLGSNFDTLLAVYRGNAVNALALVVAADDTAVNTQSVVNFHATAGVTYYIAVDGYAGGTGNINLSWRLANEDVDFNADGKADYVLYNPSTRQTALWYLDNNLYLGGGFSPTPPVGWKVIDAADFDADGNADYFLYNASTNQSAIWYLSGRTYLRGVFGLTMASGYVPIRAADLNRDQKPDYVLYNTTSRRTVIWYLNGTAYAGSAFGPTLPAGLQLIDVADFDQDGNNDFLLYQASTRKSIIWYLSGAVYRGSAYGPTIAAGYQLVGAADFNQDGSPDYILYNASTHRTAIWYLNNSAYSASAFGPSLPVGYNLVAP